MPNLTKTPNHLDAKAYTCRAIIETSKGRRGKFDYDPKERLFKLKTLLPDGMSFPLDFGFIPSTIAGDGDPLDIMVLADEPTPMGAMLEVRLLGAIEDSETENGKSERNDRILATTTVSHLYERVRTIEDLGATFVDRLTQFWIQKDALEGKRFTVLGLCDPPRAVKLIQKAIRDAKAS